MWNIEDTFCKGTFLDIGSNKPYFLRGDFIWFVCSEKVDIFAVEVFDNLPMGVRYHIFRASAGQILFPINTNEKQSDIQLLAVGSMDAQLLQIEKTRFQRTAELEVNKEGIVPLIENWITNLTLATFHLIPPKRYVLVSEDQDIVVKKGSNLLTEHKIVWVKPEQDKQFFIGTSKVAIEHDYYFPLSPNSWLHVPNKGKLHSISTEEYLEEEVFWSSLQKFNEIILNKITDDILQTQETESDRLKKKKLADSIIRKKSLFELMDILHSKDSQNVFLESELDPTTKAFHLVANKAGITVNIGSIPFDPKKEIYVEDIADACKVHLRRVALKGNWWCQDNGPLFSYIDRKPVALLPETPNKYRVIDPFSATYTKVTAKIAKEIASLGYTFTRSFPDVALSVLDMLKFSFRGCRKDFMLIFLVGFVSSLLTLLTPIFTGEIFDTIIPGGERNHLVQLVSVLIVSAIAIAIFEIAKNMSILRIEGKINSSAQEAVWDRLLRLPVAFFRNYSAGDLANRAMGMNSIRQFLGGPVIGALLGVVFALINFPLLMYYDYKLALIALLLVLVNLIVTMGIIFFKIHSQRKITEMEGKISGSLFQLITAISKIRVAGAEKRAFAVWAKQFAKQRNLTFETFNFINRLTIFNSTFPILSSMVIFASVAYFFDKEAGVNSPGIFLAFVAAYTNFLNAILAMTSAFVSVLQAMPLFERLKPILKTAPEVSTSKVDPGELSGKIELSHTIFRYDKDGPPILDDISIAANPGEFIAIVGPSGSGKSTILRLLLGFETPETGAVYYDNQDLMGLDTQSVRRQMGVVLQNNRLLPGDILSNIIGSSTYLTTQDAWNAARIAGLEEDIKSMPMGMYTVISEGGGNFSGGQRQRLMIARAVVNNPRIFLFDEATSALDDKTQDSITKSLNKIQATKIVIAHRLSTIIHADRIYVLSKGKIVERGTYKELMEQEGEFAKLAKRQIL